MPAVVGALSVGEAVGRGWEGVTCAMGWGEAGSQETLVLQAPGPQFVLAVFRHWSEAANPRSTGPLYSHLHLPAGPHTRRQHHSLIAG